MATLAGGMAHAQNTAFSLANDTEFTVYAVYIWPSDSRYRGPDRLGDDTIASGRSYTFVPTDGECTYNLRVRLAHEQEQRWDNVDLCQLTTITVHYNHVTQDVYASGD